ncbi:MAG: hypothetical protein GC131_03175 [Alphaproteobacteria bacterium]|nr:hypothetical protein [Alphaproteobacteria bacterium]
MHITLIGMSNIGKSHWARRLAAERGFEYVDCDLLVERSLGPEMAEFGEGLANVAKWLGQPYDTRYASASRQYIEHETQIMRDVLEQIRAHPDDAPLVADTTGSVIYVDGKILAELQALTRVIYLEASPEHTAHLFETYIATPKPVIWGDAFVPQPGEAPGDALKRCYPALLEARAKRYRELAHVTIPFEQHRQPSGGLDLLVGKA